MYDFSDLEEPCRYRTYIAHDGYGGHERRGELATEDSKRSWAREYLGPLLVVGLGLATAGTILAWLIGTLSRCTIPL